MKKKFKKYFLILMMTFFTFQVNVLAVRPGEEEMIPDEGYTSTSFSGDRLPVQYLESDCNIIPPEIIEIIETLWSIILIVGPAVFVITAFMDVLKLITGSDEKKNSAVIRRIVRKFIALLVLILLPLIVNFILGLINSNFGTCGIG